MSVYVGLIFIIEINGLFYSCHCGKSLDITNYNIKLYPETGSGRWGQLPTGESKGFSFGRYVIRSF